MRLFLIAMAAGLFTVVMMLLAGVMAGSHSVPYGQTYVRSLSESLVAVLEDRIPRARIEDWSQIKGLIVLGGHPSRYLEAFALAEQHPSLRIVISGASDWEMELVATTSARIRARIEFDGKSRIWFKYTYGNALYSKELISPRPGARRLLEHAHVSGKA